jgi:enoyl-CoA hydratase/carnithine racemase
MIKTFILNQRKLESKEVLMASVKYEKKGNLAFITLNRPKKLNAIDIKTAGELAKIWIDFRDDDRLWVAILKGEGRSFCAGADLERMNLGDRWGIAESLIFGDKKIGPTNYNVWKPIIAAVHGHVLGAGFYLFLESDLRIATNDAKFGLPEPKIGIPTLFAPFLQHHLHPSHAMELLLLGDPINAQRAYEIGLVNKVVPKNKLMSSVESVCKRLSHNGPLSLRAMKEAFRRSRGMNYLDTLTILENVFTPVMNSEDAAEGKRAFLKKHKPRWKGR